jgi:hypothetical protein
MHDGFAPVSSRLGFEGLLRAGQKGVRPMSRFVIVMIASWAAAIAMISCFALSESGTLLKIRKRLASWREASAAEVAASVDGLESSEEDAA